MGQEKTKAPSLYRQCEDLREALHAIYKASRYFGPRPDEVFRAMVRCNLVEYRDASEALLGEVRASENFKSSAEDREACWEKCEEEKKRLIKLHSKMRVEAIRTGVASKMNSNEAVVAAISKELLKFSQPLPPEEL